MSGGGRWKFRIQCVERSRCVLTMGILSKVSGGLDGHFIGGEADLFGMDLVCFDRAKWPGVNAMRGMGLFWQGGHSSAFLKRSLVFRDL